MLHINGTNRHQIREKMQLTTNWVSKQGHLKQGERKHLTDQIKKVRRQLKKLGQNVLNPKGKVLFSGNKSVVTVKKMKDDQYQFLTSHAANLVGCMAVLEREARKAKSKGNKNGAKPITMKELHSLASAAIASKKLAAPDHIVVKPKSDGSTRTICKFGIPAKIQSVVAEWVFLSLSHRNKFEYCKPGYGTHSAIEAIKENIEKEFRYWLVLDIENAFPSIRRGHLLDVSDVSHLVSDLLLYPVTSQTLKEAAQPSLPQGIASSSKIMSAIVGHSLRKICAKTLVIMSYVDDIVIGAQTLDELEDAFKTLQKVFEKNSAGPLHFKNKKFAPIDLKLGQFINFLGYAVSLDRIDGKIRIMPNIMAFSKFHGSLAADLHRHHLVGLEQDALLKIAHDYGNKWRSAYPLWQPGAAGEECFKAILDVAFWDLAKADFNPKAALKVGNAQKLWNQHQTTAFEGASTLPAANIAHLKTHC
jgi:hypothetical protein